MLRRVDCRNCMRHVLRRADLRASLSLSADRLNREAVSEDCVVLDLIQWPFFQRQCGGNMQSDQFALNCQFHSVIAGIRKLLELIDGEKISDPITQTFSN